MAQVPDQLRTVAKKILDGEAPEPVTVRSLLAWFGFERRGRFVVEWIRSGLAEAGLITEPDFDSVWLDAYVTFRNPIDQTAAIEDGQAETRQRPESIADEPQAPFVGGAVPDPTHKVGKLEAANRGVVSLGPEDTIQRAVTLMMANGYSQLPVMTGERDVKGVITWESIARKLVLHGACARVLDCIEQHREIAADSSLFAAIPEIAQAQYVLVRDP